jgi:hypothetical protein
MPAILGLTKLLEINQHFLCKEEILLLEADLFFRVCAELKTYFREQLRDYFKLMKFDKKKELTMLDENFVALIIKDVLLSQEYTVEGIAHYTNFPEDIFYEIIEGRNATPSAHLLQRTIELHRSVRPALYDSIIKKITSEYQDVA